MNDADGLTEAIRLYVEKKLDEEISWHWLSGHYGGEGSINQERKEAEAALSGLGEAIRKFIGAKAP